MLCLSDEDAEKFKQLQNQCSELDQKYTQAVSECNKATIEALKSNPSIDVDQLQTLQQYSETFDQHQQLVVQHNALVDRHNELAQQFGNVKLFALALLAVLAVTYFFIIVGILKKFFRWVGSWGKPKSDRTK